MNFRWLISLVLCATLVTPLGYGQQKQKKRIELNVAERKREKKSGKAKFDSRRSAVLAVEIEKKLIEGIGKTTAYLEKTAQALPKKSAQRLQILEKVLNLYMENSTYLRNEEERLYDSKWRSWEAAGRKGPEPKLDSARSNGYWRKVISQATHINKEYPRNKSADIVLFNKAIGLNYLGREKDSARILSELVTKYKGSNVAGDAYAALGDYYFDRNDFRNAKNNYQQAMRFPRSQRYLWSIFKMGWCEYNLGQYKVALSHWKDVVAKSQARGEQGVSIKEEALRDMVYAFAELRQIDSAIAYYRANNGTEYIGTFLMLLAQILSDQGQYANAIKVYKKFQTTVPFDEDAPTAQKELIAILYITGKIKMVWQELGVFYNRYGPMSPWLKRHKELAIATIDTIKDQMMYYATLSHQKAIKNTNRRLNYEARQGYLLFLQSFPKAKEIPGVKYLLADIEYFLKNYAKAGQYYYEIAALGKQKALRFNPVTKKFENIHKEAAIEMVGAYVKDFGPEFKLIKKRKPNFKKPEKLSAKARNYIKSCGKYVEWYPKDEARVKTCTTGIATIFYYNGIRDQAIKYLKQVAVTYPKAKEGPEAVRLVIPLVKDDKPQLFALTDLFLKVPAYGQGDIGKLLRGLRRGAEKDAILAEKDTLKRAKKFEAQAKKYPKDPDVDKLWFNAAVDYMKGGAVKDALRAHMVIVTRFPRKPQAKDSLLTIARVQEKLFEYQAASSSFLAFAQRYPKAPEAIAALSQSCGLLVASNAPKAIEVCLNFARQKPDYAVGHIESMIRGAFLAKQYAHMTNLITKIYLPTFSLSANQRIVAWQRIYEAYNGQGATAGQARQRMMAVYQKAANQVSGEALRAIGNFALRQALPLAARFHAQKLKGGTVDNLAATIQTKSASLQQLQQALGQVLQVKDPYSGVAAYVQLGLANEALSEELANPPVINGASKADVVKELGPQIAATKQAALGWYQEAVKVVNGFAVYSKDSVKAISGLARIGGRKFSFDDFVVMPDFVGNQVTSQWVSALRKK